MTGFQLVEAEVKDKHSDTMPDDRTLVEKMFFNHNDRTGEQEALPVTVLNGEEDWKRYTDCIPLLKNFRATDENYTGPLQGKDVLVLGGRRKGRAGTGVELIIAVEDVEVFCKFANEVAGAVKSAGVESEEEMVTVAA